PMLCRKPILVSEFLRPYRSLINPTSQESDLVGREWLALVLGRHHLVRISAGYPGDRRAVAAFSGYDCWISRIAAAECPRVNVQPESRGLLAAIMALVTVLFENR